MLDVVWVEDVAGIGHPVAAALRRHDHCRDAGQVLALDQRPEARIGHTIKRAHFADIQPTSRT